MKYRKICFLLPLLIFLYGINNLSAQVVEKKAFYYSAEFNAGNYYGLNLNANYVRDEKYSFQVGYAAHFRKAKNQPENYSPGLVGVLFLGLLNPIDQVENFHALSGRIFLLNRKGTIRINLLAGIGLAIIKEPVNWEYLDSSWLSQNYTFDYSTHSTLSFIFNPKLEFPFTRYYGFTLSPLIHINKDSNFYGIGIGHMVGLLRRKNPPKQNIDKKNQPPF